MDLQETIEAIRAALRARSDRAWSVRGDRGTAWGWVTVTAPPRRLDEFGGMSDDDQAELSRVFGQRVHHQGVSIPATAADRRFYVAAARGERVSA